MLINVLKSKIYKAKLTFASLEYSGSFGIDKAIMKKVNILPYEKLLVVNMNTGSRFETYALEEPEGSNKFSLYGAAARLGMVGDYVIIMTFTTLEENELSNYKPIILNY